MSGNANVYNIDVFLSTIKALLSIEHETKNQCAEGLNKAEEILYTEFSIVLNMSYEDTKNYIINQVEKKITSKGKIY